MHLELHYNNVTLKYYLDLKEIIEDYRRAKPCDNTFIGPVGPIKVFISPKAGKIIKIISPKAK